MKVLLCLLALVSLSLALDGDAGEYHDVLEAGQNDWRLVFRGTAHINQSVYTAYTEGYTQTVEEACKGLDFSAACHSHYRNDDALDNWWMVDEVLFGVVKGDNLVKTIKFNGTGSTYLDWFSADRYESSCCYSDLKGQPKNFFSIEGQAANDRRFFINRNYDQCHNNAGWFVALDGPDSVALCDWERDTGDYPRFLFSAGNTAINWKHGAVEQADAIVIFVKYHPYGGKSSEYFDLLDSGKKEWRLSFRATAGVGSPSYNAYYTGAGIPEDVDDGCEGINWRARCRSHYRNNDALDNYKWQDIDQVLFGIVDDDALVKVIRFDAYATTIWTWFRQSQVVDACWSDFSLYKNYFSIEGYRPYQRAFYINNNYQTCLTDAGWVVALDEAPTPNCPWEQADSLPSLRYAIGPRMVNWNDQDLVGRAQAFVVFIKYKFSNVY